jgi:hypothetical protein
LAVGVGGVAVVGEGAVLEVDPGAGGAGGPEADLDLAGPGGVGLGGAVGGDLPGEDQAGGWVPDEDAAPVAGEAVGAALKQNPPSRGSMPMSSRVSPAQVYSRGHHRARSAKAANA